MCQMKFWGRKKIHDLLTDYVPLFYYYTCTKGSLCLPFGLYMTRSTLLGSIHLNILLDSQKDYTKLKTFIWSLGNSEDKCYDKKSQYFDLNESSLCQTKGKIPFGKEPIY